MIITDLLDLGLAVTLQLWRLPLVIPDRVAIAMEASGLRALRQRIDFDHQCVGPEDLFAGVALLPVAWTSPRLRCAVAGKTTVSELRPNEKADSVRVHNDLTWATTWKRHSHQGLDSNVRPGCGRVDDSTSRYGTTHRRDVAWKKLNATAAKSDCDDRRVREAGAENYTLTGIGVEATLAGSEVGFDQKNTRVP
jgi:hypothetical protein